MALQIDEELLKSLPPEEAIAYLRQALGDGIGNISAPKPFEGEGSYSTNIYTYDTPVGMLQKQGDVYTKVFGGADPTRGYFAHFNPDGSVANVGQQIADSWYDKEVMGVPLGFLATVAAPFAASYLGPAAGVDAAGSVALTDAELAAMGIGGATEPVTTVAATLGEAGAAGAGYTPLGAISPELAAITGSAPLPSAVGATTSGWVPAALEAVKQLATTKGGMTAAGAMLGLLSSGDKESTASREPWGPAQPLLKDLVKSGQNLKNFYSQTPFNEQQQVGYNNLFSDLNSFRQSMPGLLDFANRMSGATYSRDGGMSYGNNRMFAPTAGSSYGPVNFAQYKGLL